jgi:hypothetical protein
MTDAAALAEAWPLFGLRISAGPIRLSLPSDEHLVELARIAAAGIHDPEEMPFAEPWTDMPPRDLQRSFLQYHWGLEAASNRTTGASSSRSSATVGWWGCRASAPSGSPSPAP